MNIVYYNVLYFTIGSRLWYGQVYLSQIILKKIIINVMK